MTVILVAEDDARLAGLVQSYLQDNGFTVVIEPTGYNVERRVTDLNPDIVILDIMLPGKDGLTICKDIRPKYDGAILMLTARDSNMDQVLGLEFGADDYMIKPAEPRVLLARVRALLRRYQRGAQVNESQDLTFGTLEIRATAREVVWQNESINLSTHEYDLLFELARKSGQILSREYLFNTVYCRPYDGLDRSVDVRISHLRKKLGDSSDRPEKIKTIWGKGYLFVPDVW
ncbi:MAG: DNA-binding response regulator [Alteromonadaceae bacterium]|nr:MAG: DNA-binding response regulator [Alteromonadaceae bacterium]